jgi:hypothetical protein
MGGSCIGLHPISVSGLTGVGYGGDIQTSRSTKRTARNASSSAVAVAGWVSLSGQAALHTSFHGGSRSSLISSVCSRTHACTGDAMTLVASSDVLAIVSVKKVASNVPTRSAREKDQSQDQSPVERYQLARLRANRQRSARRSTTRLRLNASCSATRTSICPLVSPLLRSLPGGHLLR